MIALDGVASRRNNVPEAERWWSSVFVAMGLAYDASALCLKIAPPISPAAWPPAKWLVRWPKSWVIALIFSGTLRFDRPSHLGSASKFSCRWARGSIGWAFADVIVRSVVKSTGIIK